jgi:hypothetical protein
MGPPFGYGDNLGSLARAGRIEDEDDWFLALRTLRVVTDEKGTCTRAWVVPGGRVELPTKGL